MIKHDKEDKIKSEEDGLRDEEDLIRNNEQEEIKRR